MSNEMPDTDELLRRAEAADEVATGALLDRHRARLRHMVNVRIDPRLAARMDPSDVVQEALGEALLKLPGYLRNRPIAFYPWLRRIAWERLVRLHSQHVYAQKRSILREHRDVLPLPDDSAVQLVDNLISNDTGPSMRAARKEMRERLRSAVEQMPPHYREVIILRHLEQLSFDEIAGVLGLSQAATRSRYRRAVERLHKRLSGDSLEDADDRA
jgi:RNA polymerase sigma-70 factor (ECF subfamily)